MLRSHPFHTAGTLVLIVALATSVARAEVTFSIVNKSTFYQQQGPTTGDVIPDEEPFLFGALVGVENRTDLTLASVRRGGGGAEPLAFNQEDGYEFGSPFARLEDLEAAYPPGDYVITYNPAGGSAVSWVLALTGSFPEPPLLEDWFDLQHIQADEAVTIGWSEFIGGTTDDMVVVEVHHADTSDVVFETGIHLFGDDNSLDGTARSVTLPAGTLVAGQSYETYFLFFDMEEVNQSSGFAASFHQTEVATTLRAVTQHPSPAIDSGVLGRWTAHRQTGPSTINPLSGEGSAWVFTSIWLDDNINNVLTSAQLNQEHSLTLSPDEEGWAFLHTVSGAEELLSWLPNGEHTLNYVFNGGNPHLTTLTLSGDLPAPVRISNWDELQSASADSVTTIRWIEPEDVRDFDGYIVTVYAADGSDMTVFETDLDLDTMSGLFGGSTSVEIPAGTLEVGKIHRATINYMHFTDIDRNSQAGAWFAAANGVETEFTINTGATGGADPVQVGGVGRDVYYFQSDPDTVALHPTDPDQFSSVGVILGDSVHQLSSASVVLPGGAERVMVYDSEDEEWRTETQSVSHEAMLADFPDGDYTLHYAYPVGEDKNATVTLGATFPGVPRITNWVEAQSVLPVEDFILQWEPIENMTEDDAIMVYLEDANGDDVYFSSPFFFLDPSGLKGDAVSFTIPAHTLEPGRTYEVFIDALHFTDRDDSREGQLFGAFNLSNTGFILKTVDANRPPTVDSLLLDDAVEGQTYTFSVLASDPDDGSNVSLQAPMLPGWLTFADQGSGVGNLSGTPSSAHVGVFSVAIEVADSQGLAAVREFALTVNPDLSDPEGRALDIASITWLRDQASPFEAQVADVQHGESALISGTVGDGSTSFVQGTFTGPMKLSFYWKVSSQAESDFFRVKVDDTVEAEISGERNWRQQILALPAGNHSVVWSYEKDGTGSSGADRAWLDHVMILPAEAGGFTGAYLGEIASSSGEVALYIRPDNTAVFLGYHPESSRGLINLLFDISDLGAFSFEVVNPDDSDTPFTVSGSISGGVATGTISGLDLTFMANLVSGGGQVVSSDGYYQGALITTISGRVYLIVANDGRAYFLAEEGEYVEGLITSIDAAGAIALTTEQGYYFALTVNPATDIVVGSYVPPGGEISGILGLREGSPGDELLANISTRGQVLGGDKVMIASFVITGSGSKQLLIRAIGPTLAGFGVTGVLPDPTIELIRLGETEPMSRNDDWGDGQQSDQVIGESARLGAFALNPGGLDSAFLLSLEPGAYTATVKGKDGLTGVGLVEVYDADDPAERTSAAEVVNIATRGEVGTDADVLIAGFVISGDLPKRVLIRGIGPQLGAFGVPGILEDPQIDLIDSEGDLVASNDDWGDTDDVSAVVNSTNQVGAFALDAGSRDAVLLIWLGPGSYTAQVSGADGGTGVALIEVYDVR